MDNAFERARAAYGTGAYDDATLEFLFPQLKESEDERIREWLINYFKKVGNSWIHREFTCNQIIAYLEKQKEANKAIEAVERIDKYIDEHLANAHDMKDSDPDKKYYSGWDDALGKMAGILQDVYSGEKQKEHFRDDTKMVEQKPAWSEEDEEMYARVVRRYTDYEGVIMRTKEESVAAKMLDAMAQEEIWLKSLHPQPKQEWDAHDKAIVGCIAVCLDGQFVTEAARKQCLEWFNKHRIDFLNSTSWRPSEEQMKALINCVIGNEYDVHALVRLWAELKKL